ncbi:unnamed protein product [Microthlaspi erraticum]|uniref:DUF4283 domain-containing protein n=1 Tax=Microthlaspi erraticum TaxID=1685480 RepID=A0A6D2HLX3_9BRAS|nr:unnamed protein product [Microthlaspi erraticum]
MKKIGDFLAILRLPLFFSTIFISVAVKDIVQQFHGGFVTAISISVVANVDHYDVSRLFISWDLCVYKFTHQDLIFLHQLPHTLSISLFRLYYRKSLCPFLPMANNLRRAIQDLNLRINDAPVALPTEVVSEAARVNQFSLIGRALIPRRQNLRAIVGTLPRNWGLTDLISGRVIERRRFQFVFPTEELMQSVLNRGPWAFNDRILVLKRWKPEMDDSDFNSIPFWVQIRGIPSQFLSRNVIFHIGDSIGHVGTIDFNPEIAAAAEFIRAKILLNVNHPLRFQKNFQFIPGVNTVIRFRYERLRGFCAACGMLTHDTGECEPQEGDDAPPHDNDDDGGSDDNQMDEEHIHIPDPMIQQL